MWHQDGVMPSLVPGPYHKKRQQVVVTKWHWMVGCCIFGIWSIDKHWTQHQTNKRCFFLQQRPPVFAHFHGSLHQRDLGIYDGRRTVEKVNRWLSRWFVILESSTKNRSCSELLGAELLGAGKCAFQCQVFIFSNLKLSWGPATESFPCGCNGCNILQVCCRNFWGSRFAVTHPVCCWRYFRTADANGCLLKWRHYGIRGRWAQMLWCHTWVME